MCSYDRRVSVSYDIAAHDRAGRESVYRYESQDALVPGSVVELGGRHWLVERVDEERLDAVPARYRLVLRHPDGHEEVGAFRRFRADAPVVGHELTTFQDGTPVSWTVIEQRLARDDADQAFLESIAERDYADVESLPDHQLEHALERGQDEGRGAAALIARAEASGRAIELVALDAGEAPDWNEATRFIDALILEEIADDVFEMCGVDVRNAPQGTWLDTVKQRLVDDLESFRADIDGDNVEIEEWDFRGGRIFAAVGSVDDESSPVSGYGWMCRLVDSETLGAAGFQRVRKAELLL
jgi:hypothetical protein